MTLTAMHKCPRTGFSPRTQEAGRAALKHSHEGVRVLTRVSFYCSDTVPGSGRCTRGRTHKSEHAVWVGARPVRPPNPGTFT